jgi:ABC-type antimicrobial peptide transport system permease subunit
VRFRLPGETEDRFAETTEITPGYFEVLRIPVIAGRALTRADRGRDVVVVSRSLAGDLWGTQSAIGRTIAIGNTPFDIVGVVADVATPRGLLRNAPVPAIYRALSSDSVLRVVVPRVLVAGGGMSPGAAAAEVKAIDPRVDVVVDSLSDNIDRQLAPHRMGARIAGALGLIAVTFASIGVFGVVAYLVQQRTREIGVRIALGARPGQIVGFILRSSSPALIVGLVVGFGAALAGSRVIESSLIGVSPLDPLAYAAVVIVLAAAAGVAVLVPASRAIRINPVTALRCE